MNCLLQKQFRKRANLSVGLHHYPRPNVAYNLTTHRQQAYTTIKLISVHLRKDSLADRPEHPLPKSYYLCDSLQAK